jgi:DNA polymerase-1
MTVSWPTEIWAADFEFRAAPGESPEPVCLVAKEIISGRTVRLWDEELTSASVPPYRTDEDVLFVAYYASAEMGCHLALGWPLPMNVLDLYAEFRVETNGKVLPHGNGLLGALKYFGHQGISALEKDAMRDLVLRGGPYTDDEHESILDYCESDVLATESLFHSTWPTLCDRLRLGHALLRGRYTKAVATMERNGIPIDTELFHHLRCHWNQLPEHLIERIDAEFGVFEGKTFKAARFEEYLTAHEIAWPRTKTGRLELADATFAEQCKSHPELIPLKDLRHTLGQLRLNDFPVGGDGRNRCMLSMFSSKTGRNQPSTTRFVFGLASWLRSLIKPQDGYGLAYVDWSQQEFGIAAALSSDQRMQEAYLSGDPYLAFAKQAGGVPQEGTKESHAKQREQFKACVLAVQYGMQEESLGQRIGQPPIYARELLKLHRQTYATFWNWSDGVLDYALNHLKLWTRFGWYLHITGIPNPRSIRNFPMQANGAEMLRLASCMGIEAGIRVIAPVHDALLIEAPLVDLDETTRQMQDLMRQASASVLDGFELRSDAKFVRAPERYLDERGTVMWNTVTELLAEMEPAGAEP